MTKGKQGKRAVLLAALLLLLLAAAFQGGRQVGAAQGTPGSVYDPLITQSYLEERLAKQQAGTSGFVQVTLGKNKVLSLQAGGQLLLYTGTAYAAGKDGLVDMTTGETLGQDISAMKYHLCLAPSDGSGIKATTSCTVYVLGEYTVK